MNRPQLANPVVALCADGASVAMAAAAAPLVDQQARTISGLVVPYGPVGQTSAGRLQFSAGSLAWSHPSRVKLLRQHNQDDPVGVGREFVELDAAAVDARMVEAGREPLGLGGLWGTFYVPEGPNGDRALAEAANGLRDALSVGVQLDDKTAKSLRSANGAAVQGRGNVREVSQVSVPAFDDARVGNVAAHAELVVTSWATPTERTPAMPDEQPTPAPAQPAQPAPVQPTPQPTQPTAPTQPAPQQPTDTGPAPAPSAVAGAAVVTAEAATYTFSGDGPSLVCDAWAARMHGDSEAASRLHRYNAELIGGNEASTMALAAVLKTTDINDGEGAGLAPNGAFQGTTTRPLREAIDRGRPLLARINTVPIRNAQPFLLPVEGEFDGVDDHVEGTAHVPEGTLTLSDATMTPRAISGAYRLSREIVDSTNPAIDRIALRAMLRDYRRKTEGKFLVALLAAAGAATPVAGPIGLDLALLMFGNDDSDEPTFVAAGKQGIVNLAGYLDGDGRQLIAPVGVSNAPGARRAGSTGLTIGAGTELVKAVSIPGTDVVAVDEQGVLVAESPTQTFRFDEVEGPGIIKLALFGYFGAAVLDDDAVERYSVAAYVAA